MNNTALIDIVVMLILAVGIIGGVLWIWTSKKVKEPAALIIGAAVFAVLVLMVGPIMFPNASVASTPPATCGPGTANPCYELGTAAATSYVPAGQSDATWYASNPAAGLSANTLFVTTLYNTTSSSFELAAKNATSGTPSTANAVTIPIVLTRTDIVQEPAQFDVTVASIYTTYSTGSSPIEVAPFVGYSTGGGVASAWQLSFTNGTQSGQNPSVSAPGTTTNVITNQVTVAAGAATTTTLKVYIGGAAASGKTAQSFPYSAFLGLIGPTGTFEITAMTLTLSNGATFADGGTTLTVVMFCYGSQAA